MNRPLLREAAEHLDTEAEHLTERLQVAMTTERDRRAIVERRAKLWRTLVSGGTPAFRSADKFRNTFDEFKGCESENGIGGSIGGASRFYYVAKPSREERDFGCHDLSERSSGAATGRKEGSKGLENPRAGAGRGGNNRNFHPTVKPVELMRWLVKLVTPISGTVLVRFETNPRLRNVRSSGR